MTDERTAPLNATTATATTALASATATTTGIGAKRRSSVAKLQR